MELKAICEMTREELQAELIYCITACEDDILLPVERSHYRRRADVIREYMTELDLSI